MRRSWAGILVVSLTACGGSVSASKDAGPAEGVSPCAGATLLTQVSTTNYEPTVAETFTAKGPVVLFGPSNGDGGTLPLTGYFGIGGYTKDESVKAQIVEYSGCSTMGCPAGFDFSMSGADGDDLYTNAESPCGSGTFIADGGYLTPSVAAGSGSNMGGPAGTNIGLLLTPQ